jgi:hypothetical protein
MRSGKLLGTVVVCTIVLSVLFAGCLEEEESPPPEEPQVEFFGPAEVWVGELVEFDAMETKDDEDKFEALNFSWEMGDGTVFWGKPFVSGSIAAPNHTYERAGTYQVNLTVYDIWGNAGHANHTIEVKYQLNLTINAQGTWIGEGALNNTTYYNFTVSNVWTDLFDVPRVYVRFLNDTGGQVRPISIQGDPAPANLTQGQSFTQQVHFRVPEGFVPISFYVTEELFLDLD